MGCVRDLVESSVFHAVIMVAIVACSMWWVIEEQVRKDNDDDNRVVWLAADILFTLIFFVEFILRFLDLRFNYFREMMNVFDFFLVGIGIFSVTVNAMQYFEKADTRDQGLRRSGILRIARVFRVFRVMRICRLGWFWQVVKARMMSKELSLEVAERVQKITILTAFVKAHALSQEKTQAYFGTTSLHDVVELAHTVLQSQVSCFRALLLAVRVQSQLDEDMLREVNEMRLRKKVAEDLQGFVVDAHHAGIITAKEADGMLHPLKEMISVCNSKIRDSHFGFVSTFPKRAAFSSNDDGESEKQDTDVYDFHSRDSLSSMDEQAPMMVPVVPASTPMPSPAASKKMPGLG